MNPLLVILLTCYVLTVTPPLHGADSQGLDGLLTPSGSASRMMTAPEIRAELSAPRRAALSSEMAGRILKMPLKEGERFQKNQLLIAIDCAIEQGQKQRVRATLNAAQSKSEIYHRLKRLNATSKMDAQEAKSELAKAKAELAIINAKLRRCRISAPFSGRVVTQSVRQYEYVKAGDPLLEIVDERHLEALFRIPSEWLRSRRIGDPFILHLEETGHPLKGRIARFGAVIDPVSQAIRVIGYIVSPVHGLLPGMSGRVRFDPPPTAQRHE
ncbi:MAG: efflux RND transporter periplasmic adaptor subunit [Magnetococcales bacterium]|nr:efflux RND transporter periplasmic adaptor subunit [Magnetococcales bacterium]